MLAGQYRAVAGLSLGVVIVCTSFVVLALWIPLRECPGIGTIIYALGIGPLVHIFLPWFTRFGGGAQPVAMAPAAA